MGHDTNEIFLPVARVNELSWKLYVLTEGPEEEGAVRAIELQVTERADPLGPIE